MSLKTIPSRRKIDEIGLHDYKHCLKVLNEQISKRNQELSYPITQSALLILTNYEVNVIILAYLSLWNKNTQFNYVPKREIENCFSPQYRGFVKHFFLNDNVSCNDFVLFVCFFMFYRRADIISILIAMSGVNSNLIITKEQVRHFLFIYSMDKNDYPDLDNFISETLISNQDINDDVYHLRLLHSYFTNNFTFSVILKKFKEEISNLTLNKESINTILNRKNYYDRIIIDTLRVLNETPNYKPPIPPLPQESCNSKMLRLFFSNKPHPYSYDHRIQCNPNHARNNLLCQLKQRYGYSRRSSSLCFQTLITSKSLTFLSHSDRDICNHNELSKNQNRIIYPSNSPKSTTLSDSSTYVMFCNKSNIAKVFPNSSHY